jgi:hypothetical protein
MVQGYTARGIPLSLRPAFQEYDIEKLDPEEHAFTIIERALTWGNREETRWLFDRYGPERLAAWVRSAGWRRLPRYRLALWATYFDLPDLPERKGIWPY